MKWTKTHTTKAEKAEMITEHELIEPVNDVADTLAKKGVKKNCVSMRSAVWLP